jgi:hypothetical protein
LVDIEHVVPLTERREADIRAIKTQRQIDGTICW